MGPVIVTLLLLLQVYDAVLVQRVQHLSHLRKLMCAVVCILSEILQLCHVKHSSEIHETFL